MELYSETTLTEITLLAFAFVLSAIIGMERQRKMKSAGLRTHTLVGLGSAVFTLVSAYGFSHVVGADVILDPSRIAAQIVSGIGFLGAGVIFVRKGAVSGLTTAASIWVTAAIGMACGAGMPIIAVAATVLHLLTVGVLTFLGRVIRPDVPDPVVTIRYRRGHNVLTGGVAILGCALFLSGRRSSPVDLGHDVLWAYASVLLYHGAAVSACVDPCTPPGCLSA